MISTGSIRLILLLVAAARRLSGYDCVEIHLPSLHSVLWAKMYPQSDASQSHPHNTLAN